jgi:hypothetical protein
VGARGAAGVHHARLDDQRFTHLFALGAALAAGPLPADEALRKLDALSLDAPDQYVHRALLLAMLGPFEEALPIAHEASERWPELIHDDSRDAVLAEIATLAGDREAAARHLRT